MGNSVRFLDDRFIAFSGTGKIQPDKETPMLDADIDTRHKCTIALEDNVDRRNDFDCEQVDLVNQKIRTRNKRLRLTYPTYDPQVLAFWTALHLGQAAAPTGTPADEVQTLTRTGTITAGSFKITVALEGMTAQTSAIPFDATAAQVEAALTAARMKWIEPGDIEVTGDWTGGIVLTFSGRLAKADIPLVTIDSTGLTGGTVGAAQTTPGAQRKHVFTRAVSREKVRFGFALGYLDGALDPVKYSGFVVESLTPGGSRRQPAALEVSIVGLFEGDPMDGYVIPACENPTALESHDIRVSVDNNWETSDLSTISVPLNDNVPLDDSAYGFVGSEPDLLARAKQVIYDVNAQIFATEEDGISIKAENERTQAPVDFKIHFGMPGNRVTYLMPETKVKFATGERFTAVGAAERLAGNFVLTGFKNGEDPPLSAEAYVSQSAAFLVVSE